MSRLGERANPVLPDLRGLMPEGVELAVEWIDDHTLELVGSEGDAIARAVKHRRHEFATGRVLARRGIEALGHGRPALEREAESRLPRWPEGIVGSISHSGPLCAVAVALAATHAGLGLDLEPDEPTDSDIERIVLRGDEADWVADVAGDRDERARRARIVFSVKEAVYKAFYPRTRVFWSFQDVGVAIDLEDGRFEARLPDSAGRPRVEGRIFRRAGWILSGVALGADG